jgi:hypothetical protein
LPSKCKALSSNPKRRRRGRRREKRRKRRKRRRKREQLHNFGDFYQMNSSSS